MTRHKALGDSTVIDKIRPHGMPWLQNDSIALNGGFVAVIGARGSGKTALVDMIAAGAQAPPDSSGQLLVSQTGHRSSRGFGFVWMSQARFRSGWNGFPRHTSANANLVSSDVVYHESEKWDERSGAAESSRPWQLPDGLVNVAQASAGHGEARAGEIAWRG